MQIMNSSMLLEEQKVSVSEFQTEVFGEIHSVIFSRTTLLAYHLTHNWQTVTKHYPMYMLVGDDAFPLHEQKNEQRIFSYRLSGPRQTAENAFGIMANRFRIFQSPIDLSSNKTEVIVLTCTALHNLLRRQIANSYSPPAFFNGH